MKLNLIFTAILLAILLTSTAQLRSDTIILVSGESLQVEIIERNPDTIIASHAILGQLEINRNQIKSILTADAKPPADEAPTPVAAQPSPSTPAPQKPNPWQSKFALGFGAQSGNTETTNLNFILTTLRELETQKTALDARFFYSTENGDANTNRLSIGGVHDWLLLDSPWSYFVDARYDYDDFNSWLWRLNGHGGLGYELIQKEDLTLLLRAGLGAAKEFKSKRNQAIPEGLLAGELKWQISDRQDLSFDSTFFPDFDESGEFRNVTGAAWNYQLDDESSLALSLGLYNEYQSKTDPGNDKNDLRIFGGLSFDF